MSDPHTHWSIYESPIGKLTILAGPGGIMALRFPGRSHGPLPGSRQAMPDATAQLDAYFAGERRAFELELDLHGSALQQQVWGELSAIPYGTTTTYGSIARRIDESVYDPELEPYMRPRAVGSAVGSNPIPILLPCHRVIGADGSLTGYRGGLERKRALLELERGRDETQPMEQGSPERQLGLL